MWNPVNALNKALMLVLTFYALNACAQAQSAAQTSLELVQKQVFTTRNFQTFNDQQIAEVKVGWATAYPDYVERVISVIGMGAADPWTIAGLQQWANPIIADPNWNNGNYYNGEAPSTGLRQALGMVTLQAMHP